jgi:hypothetical protein
MFTTYLWWSLCNQLYLSLSVTHGWWSLLQEGIIRKRRCEHVCRSMSDKAINYLGSSKIHSQFVLPFKVNWSKITQCSPSWCSDIFSPKILNSTARVKSPWWKFIYISLEYRVYGISKYSTLSVQFVWFWRQFFANLRFYIIPIPTKIFFFIFTWK